MREANRNKKLFAILGRKYNWNIFTVSRRANADIDDHVKNAPAKTGDKFGLRVGRPLKVHPSYGSGPDRMRLIVLDKSDRSNFVSKTPLIEGFREPSSGVGKAAGRQYKECH